VCCLRQSLVAASPAPAEKKCQSSAIDLSVHRTWIEMSPSSPLKLEGAALDDTLSTTHAVQLIQAPAYI
jgi:hypothetical protein